MPVFVISELEANVSYIREQQRFSTEFVEALHDLSEAYFGIDAARSLQLSHEAHEVALAIHDQKLQAVSLWQIAWVYAVQGEMDQSLTQVTAAYLLVQDIKDKRLEAKIVYVMGLIQGVTGNYAESLQYRMRALEIAREVGNRSLEADCLNAIGAQYSDLGDHRQTLNNYLAALEIFRELHSDHEAAILANIANAYTKLRDYAEAIHYGELALEVSSRSKTTWFDNAILRVLGDVYLEMGEGDVALSHFHRALALYQKPQANGQLLREEYLTLLIDIGKAHVLRKSPAEAVALWDTALAEANQVGAKPLQMQLHDLLYQFDKTSGRLDSALKHHEAWAELKQDIFNAETDRRIKTLQVMHDTKEAQREAEILRLKTTELEFMVQTRTRALEASQIEMLERLAIAIEARDSGTGDHIKRVGALAANLAARLGLDAETTELIRLAAPLHDIGKIGIPDHILLKRKELSQSEIELMREHTVVGAKMLSHGTSKLLRMAEAIALSHHEHWNGAGYPYQLTGEMIPLPGRIVAVADAYDAIVHARSYKPAIPREQALSEIARCAGTQFDPNVVTALLALETLQGRLQNPPDNHVPRS